MIRRYAAGVLVRNDRLLLGLRSSQRASYPNVWDFIGGSCEGNESFEEAMKRELKEEINIVALMWEDFITIDRSPDFILHLFLITGWSGTVINADKSEHEQVAWFTFAEAETLTYPAMEYYQLLQQLKLRGDKL